MSYLERPRLIGETPTSAMVEATSASMATGCPNKPRKAVQKEGKVSSSNVLDPWIPWILRKKNDMPDIFNLLIFDFWLQMIYSCLRKPKKRVPPKKDQFFKAAIFLVQKVTTVKIPNLKDESKVGPRMQFFFMVRAHNSRSWGPLLIAAMGPTLYIFYMFFFNTHCLQNSNPSVFQQQKSFSWHIPVSQAFATKWANDPRVAKPWCGFVVSWNFSRSLTCPPNKNKSGQREEVENKWGSLTNQWQMW